MMDDKNKMELIKEAAKSDYKGSFNTLFGEQQGGMEVASTPQEQEQGLRGSPEGTSMAFPDVSGDFNTKGMDYPIDVKKYDEDGDLVRSYEGVPPGVESLPMGDDVGTVIETPAEYQSGGFKEWKSELPDNLRDTDTSTYNLEGAYEAGLKPLWFEEDKSYHLNTVDPTTGSFLKSKAHPTTHKETDWFKSQRSVNTGPNPMTHKIVTDPEGHFGYDQLKYEEVGNFVGPSEYQSGGFKGYDGPEFDPYAELSSVSDNTAVTPAFETTMTTRDFNRAQSAAEKQKIDAVNASGSGTGRITSTTNKNIINTASNLFGSSQTGGGVEANRRMLTQADQGGGLNTAIEGFSSSTGNNIIEAAAGSVLTAPVVNPLTTKAAKAVKPLLKIKPINLGHWSKVPSLFKNRPLGESINAFGKYAMKGNKTWGQYAGKSLANAAYTAHAPFIAGMPGVVDFQDSYLGKSIKYGMKGEYGNAALAVSEIFGPATKLPSFALNSYKIGKDLVKGEYTSAGLRSIALGAGFGSGAAESTAKVIKGGADAFRKSTKLGSKFANDSPVSSYFDWDE